MKALEEVAVKEWYPWKGESKLLSEGLQGSCDVHDATAEGLARSNRHVRMHR